MKKHYFICLLILCVSISSCENAFLEEEYSTTLATTKSNLDELGYYGSNFQNIQTLETEYGIEEAGGYITFNPDDAEYSFTLGTSLSQTNVKCIVSVVDGNIFYKGSNMGNQIYGEAGFMNFTVKFTGSMGKVTLTLKSATPISYIDNRISSRLVIDQRKYKGEILPLPTSDTNICDLIVGRLP